MIIGIDPGHTAWAICVFNEGMGLAPNTPDNCNFITGKEKPNTVGCPELARNLEKLLAMGEADVVIEEPMTNPKLMKPVVSLNRDIGYIQCVVDEKKSVMARCLASDWKKFLEAHGLLPPKSGLIKPDDYTRILNKHFNTELTPDEWAAWAMVYWCWSEREV